MKFCRSLFRNDTILNNISDIVFNFIFKTNTS